MLLKKILSLLPSIRFHSLLFIFTVSQKRLHSSVVIDNTEYLHIRNFSTPFFPIRFCNYRLSAYVNVLINMDKNVQCIHCAFSSLTFT